MTSRLPFSSTATPKPRSPWGGGGDGKFRGSTRPPRRHQARLRWRASMAGRLWRDVRAASSQLFSPTPRLPLDQRGQQAAPLAGPSWRRRFLSAFDRREPAPRRRIHSPDRSTGSASAATRGPLGSATTSSSARAGRLAEPSGAARPPASVSRSTCIRLSTSRSAGILHRHPHGAAGADRRRHRDARRPWVRVRRRNPRREARRDLGYPTANLKLDTELSSLKHASMRCGSATTARLLPSSAIFGGGAGRRPTSTRHTAAEVFLFDFNGDLYALC